MAQPTVTRWVRTTKEHSAYTPWRAGLQFDRMLRKVEMTEEEARQVEGTSFLEIYESEGDLPEDTDVLEGPLRRAQPLPEARNPLHSIFKTPDPGSSEDESSDQSSDDDEESVTSPAVEKALSGQKSSADDDDKKSATTSSKTTSKK